MTDWRGDTFLSILIGLGCLWIGVPLVLLSIFLGWLLGWELSLAVVLVLLWTWWERRAR